MQAKYTTYRIPKGESLFEEDFSIEALSKMGNPLEQLLLLGRLLDVSYSFGGCTSHEDVQVPSRTQTHRCRVVVQNHISSTLLWFERPSDTVSYH